MSLFFNIKIYIDKIVYIIYDTIITRNIKKGTICKIVEEKYLRFLQRD